MSGTDIDPGLPDGVHTFAARAVNATGESGPSLAPISWRIARQPPAPPSISTDTPSTTTGTNATIAFSGSPAATFACSLDGEAFSTCTSPSAFAALALGSHSVRVRQTDVYGHTSNASTVVWEVTAPALPLAPLLVPEAPVPPAVKPEPPVVPTPKSFLVQVRYRIPTGCAGACHAQATLAALLAGTRTRTLGARAEITLPRGIWARFTITVDKAALLASPGNVVDGLRTTRTRLTVQVTRRAGARLTTRHEGHISVSVRRLETGAAPAAALRCSYAATAVGAPEATRDRP